MKPFNWLCVGLASTQMFVALTSGMAQHSADHNSSSAEKRMKYAIVIHGGAGSSPHRFSDEANRQRRQSMEQALKIGTDILKSGGSSLDAVEAVVRFLEDDPQFNAGVGAVFNDRGSHELDASIMDGRELQCGAVAGVSHVRNPISLARLVMVRTNHVLLAGGGAEEFAKDQGVEMVEPSHFDTPATRAAWERLQRELQNDETPDESVHIRDEDTGSYLGTVGCAALDQDGNLAAATSTGGLTNKRFGRVGDSPIVGAGTYADNRTCAVSCTGVGEQFIRHAVAFQVSARMRFNGEHVDDAVKHILSEELNPGDGGIIAVDRLGNISMHFNTDGMARAAADSNGRFEVLWDEEVRRDVP